MHTDLRQAHSRPKFLRMSERPPAAFPKGDAEQTLQNIIASFARHGLSIGEEASIEEEITGISMKVRSILCEEVNWCTHLCTYTNPQNHRLMIAIKLAYGIRKTRRDLIIHLDQDSPDETGVAWIDPRTRNNVMDIMRTISMSQSHLTTDRLHHPFFLRLFMTFVERIAAETTRRNAHAPKKRRWKK